MTTRKCGIFSVARGRCASWSYTKNTQKTNKNICAISSDGRIRAPLLAKPLNLAFGCCLLCNTFNRHRLNLINHPPLSGVMWSNIFSTHTYTKCSNMRTMDIYCTRQTTRTKKKPNANRIFLDHASRVHWASDTHARTHAACARRAAARRLCVTFHLLS